jgi:hypothetical protein
MPKPDAPINSGYDRAEREAWGAVGAVKIRVAGLRLFALSADRAYAAEPASFAEDAARYYWYPLIEHALAGEGLGWAGGPVAADGWYIIPYCAAGCCRPTGPFPNWPSALLYARREYLEGGL